MPSRGTKTLIPIGIICLLLIGACGSDDDSMTDTDSIGKILFVSNRDGDEQVYVMNADGTDVLKLTDIHEKTEAPPAVSAPALSDSADLNAHGEFNLQPAWSPDGARIAFVSTRDGNREIYVMNADGSNPINLTNDPATDLYPTWSPDGSQLAFASSRDGNAEIYVMNADGSNPVNITNHPKNDTTPSWSPK